MCKSDAKIKFLKLESNYSKKSASLDNYHPKNVPDVLQAGSCNELYSSLLNCAGGHFASLENFYPIRHFIIPPILIK